MSRSRPARRPHDIPADAAGMPNDDRDTRYGHNSGSGNNQPKRHERKEQRPDWKPRQGGDQTRGDEDRLDPPTESGELEERR